MATSEETPVRDNTLLRNWTTSAVLRTCSLKIRGMVGGLDLCSRTIKSFSGDFQLDYSADDAKYVGPYTRVIGTIKDCKPEIT